MIGKKEKIFYWLLLATAFAVVMAGGNYIAALPCAFCIYKSTKVEG